MTTASALPTPATPDRSRARLWALCLLATLACLQTACVTTGGGSGSGPDPNHPAVKRRAAEIAAEPPGDYWVGRRWWTEGTRFWGYLRRPGRPWSEAQLVMMNESVKHTPDRLQEDPASGPGHGFDHNYEYRIWGRFSGQQVYDPNSNLMLPEFVLQNYEVVSAHPGFLFQPGEQYNPKRLPPKFPPIPR